MYISPVYYPTSTASITTHEVLKGLAEKGNHVDLLVSSRCFNECLEECVFDCDETERITVHRVSILTPTLIEQHISLRLLLFTFSFVSLVLYAFMVAKKKKHELIMVTYHATHLAPLSAYLISRVLKVPLMIKIHDAVSSEARWGIWDKVFRISLSQLNAIALKRADRILALSKELALLVRRTYSVDEKRFAILPNSVDTQMFVCDSDERVFREKLGVRDTKVIMHIGSLVPSYRRNGIKFLIQALPLVLSKEEKVAILLVGEVDARIRKELASSVSTLKIEKHLKFVGQVAYKDMPKYISIADVCVGPLCPSMDTYGSTPRKVLEYMACAKPVIACEGCVARDLVVSGHNGLLMRYGDIEELAHCIVELVGDEKRAKTMGMNGRCLAKNSYDQRVLANRLDKEIKELLLMPYLEPN